LVDVHKEARRDISGEEEGHSLGGMGNVMGRVELWPRPVEACKESQKLGGGSEAKVVVEELGADGVERRASQEDRGQGGVLPESKLEDLFENLSGYVGHLRR